MPSMEKLLMENKDWQNVEVWLVVDTGYGNHILFSENENAGWIYKWFSEKMEGLESKLEYNAEIKISNNTINEFFHDCFDIYIDINQYILDNPAIIMPEYLVSPIALNQIRCSAHRVLKSFLEGEMENLSDAKYYLGVGF